MQLLCCLLGWSKPVSYTHLDVYKRQVGQRILGLGLMSVNGRPASVVQVAIRSLLPCLAIPALIWDRDGRGLHDKAANTVLVRR